MEKYNIAKKREEMSILCEILTTDNKGKADLVLEPNIKLEVIQALKEVFKGTSNNENNISGNMDVIQAFKGAFKGMSDHEIQQLMNLWGSETSHSMEQGQQSSNMTEELQDTGIAPSLERIIGKLKHMEAVKMELDRKENERSIIRDRATTSTSAVQHSYGPSAPDATSSTAEGRAICRTIPKLK